MESAEIRAQVAQTLESLQRVTARLTGLLTELDGGEGGVQVLGQGRWTKEKFATLWASVEHLSGIGALFAATAARPNETVGFSEVLKRSGLDERQQRSEHARMTRIARQLFNDKSWPIENFQGRPTASHSAPVLYRMGSTVAGWWHEIANGAGTDAPTRPAPRRKNAVKP